MSERLFPMQGQPNCPIPWAVAEAIYETMYAPLYGRGQSLQRIAERGGFAYGEIKIMAAFLNSKRPSREEGKGEEKPC